MTTTQPNPLLQPWDAPFQLPPFDRTSPDHFAPALREAMAQHLAEIDAIAADPQPPTFDNTLAALDRSGKLLRRVVGMFGNLCSSHSSEALRAVEREMAVPLAAHENAVTMHAGLFRRIDALHERRRQLGLDPEQLRLLERMHLGFVRSGARLDAASQSRHAAITERLAAMSTAFGQNVLHEETAWHLPLSGDDVEGLPEFVLAAAAGAAAERGLPGHVITLSRSLIVPFLTFSRRRDLREKAWRAWTSRGEHAGEHDNRPLIGQIVQLRHELAQLHGYATYADYALVDRMAGKPAAVDELLDNVYGRALKALSGEREAIDALRRDAGDSGELQPWDWRFWAEQVRQRQYAVDDAEVKPYFPLDAMVQSAFDCAQRLFGIRFVARPELKLYHPDVKAYEVIDAAGAPVGLFLHDNFARPGKRSGAWMNGFHWQARNGGTVRPVIINNNNFAKGEPTLLSFDDVRTLFHEFGHGLHGLLSDVTYRELSGTRVLRDFVELPSQLFEHWAEEREVLQRHARHVATGEPIPEALVTRIQHAQRFGQGYETVRYCASAIVDMAVHTHPDPASVQDWVAFEAQVLRDRGLPPAAGLNHRLPHFQHLFSGGYAAGYYVYLWAEVLDADAYDAFVEAGNPFDADVAARLKRCIYGSGNTMEPGRAYEAFRGRGPRIEPLLAQKGLLQPA
ncbi:M3 family metallopeptidase [Ramlibacter algicola]|uniref:M3 family metallopeptidase n=1 Tax=Ramlibacter algicola TaxID=2795217 RepID=A0A934PZM3_9BURK|nr:M3 family metallopeptidase [Ramlibacter algicola]MBK0392323.1 M3 family metallopeptidase [Ramlibacter algicola]